MNSWIKHYSTPFDNIYQLTAVCNEQVNEKNKLNTTNVSSGPSKFNTKNF